MADGARRSRALILGASIFSLALGCADAGFAQTADGRCRPLVGSARSRPSANRSRRKAQAAAAPVMNARAQIGGTPVQSLDTITVAASKTEERAIDALAPVSVVTLEQIQGLQPKRLSDIFYNVPGVTFQERGDDPVDRRSTSAACRISAASPSSSMARGRTTSAPATTPTARSSSIPNWSAASTSCAARPRTSTAPARSAAWFRSAPRTFRTWCVPANAGASI